MAVIALSACQADQADPAGNAQSDPVKSAQTEVNTSEGGGIHARDGEIEFDYTWPPAAEHIPSLASWLNKNGEGLKAKTLAGGRTEKASAAENGYPFRGFTYEEHWKPVADLPALLVMQSEGYTFTGGAHGMPIVTTLIWDRVRERRLAPNDLIDMSELTSSLRQRFCQALDEERAKRRGAKVDHSDPNQISGFVECVDMAKQIVLPISLHGKMLDTIRVVILPYEAGPYAEGIYQLDLPVDASALRAVKPDYKTAFGAGAR